MRESNTERETREYKGEESYEGGRKGMREEVREKGGERTNGTPALRVSHMNAGGGGGGDKVACGYIVRRL